MGQSRFGQSRSQHPAVWCRVVQGSPNQQQPTTTITTTTPTPPEMEGGGQTQKKCGPEGEERSCPEGWATKGWAPSPGVQGLGLQGLGFRSECGSLGFGLFGIWPKHKNTKIGQSRFGQSRSTHCRPWPVRRRAVRRRGVWRRPKQRHQHQHNIQHHTTTVMAAFTRGKIKKRNSGQKRQKNTTNIPLKDFEEREERKKIVVGEGKLSEILCGPAEGRSGGGAVRRRGGVPRRDHTHTLLPWWTSSNSWRHQSPVFSFFFFGDQDTMKKTTQSFRRIAATLADVNAAGFMRR